MSEETPSGGSRGPATDVPWINGTGPRDFRQALAELVDALDTDAKVEYDRREGKNGDYFRGKAHGISEAAARLHDLLTDFEPEPPKEQP